MGLTLNELFANYGKQLNKQKNILLNKNKNIYLSTHSINPNTRLYTVYKNKNYLGDYPEDYFEEDFKFIQLHPSLRESFDLILEDFKQSQKDLTKAKKIIHLLMRHFPVDYPEYLPEFMQHKKIDNPTPDKELSDLLSKYYFFSIID